MEKNKVLSLDRIMELFEDIPDPRRPGGNIRHKLVDLLVIILLGVICGYETWLEIEDYAHAKEEWLRTFLDLSEGIPSNDTYRRLMTRIQPEKLEEAYRQWVLPYVGGCIGKHIAVDGKTICAASNYRLSNEETAEGKLHIISAWVREDGISLGQIKTEEKSNEITAIPKMLDTLDIKGAVVTIDAMGCQADIAKKIVDRDANYLLALKKNQPSLYESVDEYFNWARTEPIEKKQLREYQYEEHEHGRHINRTVEVCNDITWIETVREWKQLSSIICVTRKGEREGRQTEETAYYISSREWEAEEVAKYIQGHWTIENNLHWSLDVAFNEDSSKIHLGYSAENLSVIRKIAQKLLKTETTFKGGSIRRKAKRAALLNEYAEKILMLDGQL
ncbi:MAG: ISAs1 family transposase [Oscillospiraceae bacterium]|nr:ISAs1 family transposase [Oscillospiraceae bacterium]